MFLLLIITKKYDQGVLLFCQRQKLLKISFALFPGESTFRYIFNEMLVNNVLT